MLVRMSFDFVFSDGHWHVTTFSIFIDAFRIETRELASSVKTVLRGLDFLTFSLKAWTLISHELTRSATVTFVSALYNFLIFQTHEVI